jgi:hypothetical protein
MNAMLQNRGAAIGAQMTSAIDATPVSDVQAQLDDLEDSITRMEAVTSNLLARLSPVLRSSAPLNEKAAADRALSATLLATQIGTSTSRIDSLRAALADAYERLGI